MKDYFDTLGRAANDYKHVKEIAKELAREYVEWDREGMVESVDETDNEYGTVARDIIIHQNLQSTTLSSALATPTHTHSDIIIHSQLIRGISIMSTILSNALRPSLSLHYILFSLHSLL